MRTLTLIIALILVFFCGNFTLAVTPTNMIVLIGDGMGFEHVKAAGMYANGAAGTLCFESFPYNAELQTYSANSSVTDSAAAATAIATGIKVNNDVVSMAFPGDGSELETMLENLQTEGKSTGLVTTTYMTHATPACFGAHESSRSNYSNIATDYLNQTRPNVLFGGGANGISAASATTAGYTVVTDRTSMQALDTNSVDYVSGQFGSTHLPYEYDGLGSLPHLSEMTATALDILDNEPNGFFLMVEGGKIDHAAHDNDLVRMIHEAVEFDNTVQVVIDWAAGRTDTLILVTADHETGGLTVLANNGIGNYPTVSWSTGNHTAANIPAYAWGVNSEMISGTMENTDMFLIVTGETQAFNPNPADGAVGVSTTADLSWSAGKDAISHNVYFGTDYNNVNDATDPNVLPGRGNQTATTFDPDTMVYTTTYYWRIDEVNEADPNIWTGWVWSFMVSSYFPMDPSPADGYQYAPPDANLTWTEGYGALRHKVFFGTVSPPPFTGVTVYMPDTTYDPGPLELNETYYWQIYAFDGPDGTKAGPIWSFTVSYQADLDTDGDVDFADYAALAGRWMDEGCAEPGWCDGTDLNKSGSVDLYDLAEFVEYWLLGTSP